MGGTYVERAPPADLAAAVACSWTLTTGTGGMALVPDGCLDLLWIGGGRFVVCGPETSAWRTALPPGVDAVGVRFRPGVAPSALGIPAVALRDVRVPVDQLWGATADQVAERIAEAPSATARVAVLEGVVRARLAAGPAVDPLARAVASRLAAPPGPSLAGIGAEGAVAEEGGVGVGRLAADLGYSPRQLHRRSVAAFGYGPAVLARILRLQRFIGLARSGRGWVGRDCGVAALAAAAGYADGPHLARECRAIAGVTPSVLAGRAGPRGPDRGVDDASDPFTTLSHPPSTVW